MDKKRRDWRWLKLKDEYINPVKNLSTRLSPIEEDQLLEYDIDPNSVTLQSIKWVDYRVEHLGQNTFEIQIPSSAIERVSMCLGQSESDSKLKIILCSTI